jgi:hypothetical protein
MRFRLTVAGRRYLWGKHYRLRNGNYPGSNVLTTGETVCCPAVVGEVTSWELDDPVVTTVGSELVEETVVKVELVVSVMMLDTDDVGMDIVDVTRDDVATDWDKVDSVVVIVAELLAPVSVGGMTMSLEVPMGPAGEVVSCRLSQSAKQGR